MKLPCHLTFPGSWLTSIEGVTANLHRNGVLVACDLSSAVQPVPALGERAAVRIDLPSHPSFGQKCIDCETTLVRIRHAASGEWQFALRIDRVCFSEGPAFHAGLLETDAESCRYVV